MAASEILAKAQAFMFTAENMRLATVGVGATTTGVVAVGAKSDAIGQVKEKETVKVKDESKPSTIMQTFVARDKLFLQFYILLHGTAMVDAHKANWFTVEKQFKIQAVERLKEVNVKDALKMQKLKLDAIEDELVNQATIGLSGLYALCHVHKVNLLYVKGRKYLDIHANNNLSENVVPVLQEVSCSNGEIELHLENTALVNDIYANYWPLESLQKQLRSPSAYTLAELQEICKRLQISVSDNQQKKLTKPVLYGLILEKLD